MEGGNGKKERLRHLLQMMPRMKKSMKRKRRKRILSWKLDTERRGASGISVRGGIWPVSLTWKDWSNNIGQDSDAHK